MRSPQLINSPRLSPLRPPLRVPRRQLTPNLRRISRLRRGRNPNQKALLRKKPPEAKKNPSSNWLANVLLHFA
jgi:hypothetical protein